MALDKSYRELDQNLSELYEEYLSARCELLRKLVVDNPTLETEIFEPNGLYLGTRNQRYLMILALFHWYFPDEVRVLTNLWLEENWGCNHKEVKEVILLSKETALGYLLVQDKFGNNDFYGNYVDELHMKNLAYLFRVHRKKTSKPKKKVFRRGYNDKGSLSPPHRTKSYNYRLLRSVEEQLEIEILEANKVQDLLSRIKEKLLSEKVG